MARIDRRNAHAFTLVERLVVLADGSVRFVSFTIQRATYQSLGSRGSGEALTDF